MLIRVNVDNPADKITEFGAGAKLYWQRDNASASGAFGDGSGNVDLDPEVTQYEIIDAAGILGAYYRTRVGNALGTLNEEWSDVFQAGAITAYATLDSLREYVDPPDDSQDNLLSDLLVAASAYIDGQCKRDFYRHPQVTGTEVRTLNGTGRRRLFVRAGIVSLTGVRLAELTGGPYTSLAGSDWFLGPDEARGSYDWIELSDQSAYTEWWTGQATVELTGVFGQERVPEDIVKATLDVAREWYRQGPGGGGPVGVSTLGTPIFANGMPFSVQKVIDTYARRQLVH